MRPSLVLLALALCTPALASAGPAAHAKDLKEARRILGDLGPTVPRAVWEDARCVSVMTIHKGGFVVAGFGGRAYLTCREDGAKTFGPPIVQKVGGGSAGAQIGGQRVELVMIFSGAANISEVANTTPVFSGSASATAGEEGVGASAGGAPVVAGAVTTISKSKGLYAGATFEGMVVDPDERKTAELLGRWADPAEILFGDGEVPAVAKDFVDDVAIWATGEDPRVKTK